jgi:hypothetical protein
VIHRFCDGFRKALPHLSEEEVAYRLYFLGGVAVNTLTEVESIKTFTPELPSFEDDPESVFNHLIDFVRAGMTA